MSFLRPTLVKGWQGGDITNTSNFSLLNCCKLLHLLLHFKMNIKHSLQSVLIFAHFFTEESETLDTIEMFKLILELT